MTLTWVAVTVLAVTQLFTLLQLGRVIRAQRNLSRLAAALVSIETERRKARERRQERKAAR